jgi:hypothetical protein
VYARAEAGDSVDVRVVADPMRCDGELSAADMVIAYHPLGRVEGWRDYLRTLSSLARKVFIVTTCNPDNWGFRAVSLLGRVNPPDHWRTDHLAPVLWRLGRVRDHVYFDAPWWPDLPVAPGQSLGNRLRHLVATRGGARFAPSEHGVEMARTHVYGADKWPYFGGPGWLEELQPALLRHPAFEGSAPLVARVTSHLHAFVVDRRGLPNRRGHEANSRES